MIKANLPENHRNPVPVGTKYVSKYVNVKLTGLQRELEESKYIDVFNSPLKNVRNQL